MQVATDSRPEVRIGCELTDQLPIQMVFRFSKRYAFCGDNLRSLRVSASQGEFDSLHERGAEIANDLTAWRLGVGIKPKLSNQVGTDLYVRFCLFQILVPFFAEIFVDRATKCCRVDLDAALFSLQCLEEQVGRNTRRVVSLYSLSPLVRCARVVDIEVGTSYEHAVRIEDE